MSGTTTRECNLIPLIDHKFQIGALHPGRSPASKSAERQPPVNAQHLTRDVSRFLGSEEYDGMRHVLGLSQTASRDPLGELIASGVPDSLRHVGLDKAGSNCIDGDVSFGELGRDAMREPVDPPL